MSKKIIYSTVMYECKEFKLFLNDYLKSVFCQVDIDFEVLIINDQADGELIRSEIASLNSNHLTIHVFDVTNKQTHIELRKRLIDLSYDLNADVLIFSDFDENVDCNRVKEIRNKIDNYSFVFNDFYIVDKNLNRLGKESFFGSRSIPRDIDNWKHIKSFNYIGFGSMAINLTEYNYRDMMFPDDIRALDWFIATKVLIDGGKGLKLDKTFANYRQHDESFVGFDFKLTEDRLAQGISIKKSHYNYFRHVCAEFEELYSDVIELERFIEEIGKDKYISIINARFNTNKFCWWENIKLKKELYDDF
ncbi:MAG: hypothetical protein DIZ80_15810 [endosymbiont of Galathealinum brachiosum]|uniref:Glycosyltransferase 2-like domain-containing protein n=1 Tax=endosymbiont of Galathealinum brachiosum TaxID=2200906 RepID=A0A370D9H6_9GAMM|nr:MAG: hypothetical protein DIZ80_15810 [endosymbiont of Galathealinum brachiosum]